MHTEQKPWKCTVWLWTHYFVKLLQKSYFCRIFSIRRQLGYQLCIRCGQIKGKLPKFLHFCNKRQKRLPALFFELVISRILNIQLRLSLGAFIAFQLSEKFNEIFKKAKIRPKYSLELKLTLRFDSQSIEQVRFCYIIHVLALSGLFQRSRSFKNQIKAP